MTSNDEFGTLSGSYALNAVDAEELAGFEKHLANSTETRDEVTELTDTAVALGLAVKPVEPSVDLKNRIMSQLDAFPQLDAGVDAGGATEASTPVRFAERKAAARWFSRPVIAITAAAASVALIVGVGIAATSINQQPQTRELSAIQSANDSQTATIDAANGVSATLVWSLDLRRSALKLEGLAPLPADKVYELWYMNESGAHAAGTFSVTASGDLWRVLSGKMSAGDTVGMTIEPLGGSDAPTTDPLFAIKSA
jgi:anti-sigma-K factor RskA